MSSSVRRSTIMYDREHTSQEQQWIHSFVHWAKVAMKANERGCVLRQKEILFRL